VGVHRVRGDQDTGQVEIVDQRGEPGDLVGLVGDLALRDDGAGLAEHGGQQVHSAAIAGPGAAQRLAVHGEHLRGGQAGVEPGAEHRVEQVTVTGLQGAADVDSHGGTNRPVRGWTRTSSAPSTPAGQ
jgi:hypothetical protein